MPAPRGLEALESREERLLAGRVSGLLYLAAAAISLVYLALPGSRAEDPLVLAALAVAGLVWSAACLTLVPWARGPKWLAHFGAAAGLLMIAAAVAVSGGAQSPARFFVVITVIYATWFFPLREASGYVVASVLVLLSPLLYDPSPAGYPAEVAVFASVLLAAGACLAAAREIQRAAAAHARALAAEQAALRRVATAVASGSPPASVHALVASEAAHLLAADGSAVLRFDRTESALLVGLWSRGAPTAEAGTRIPFTPGAPLAMVRDSGRPVCVGDLQAVPHVDPSGQGFRSALFVPVEVHGQLWGVLGVVSGEPDRWDAAALANLADFAELLATAIAETEDRQRLADQAANDPLTCLPNHRAFQERLREEVGRARRHGRPLSVAIVDIDNFREANRALGHDGGDEVLADVAARLQAALRSHDVLARTGGDEFAVLLPETDRAQAHAVLDRARMLVASEPLAHRARLTISAGICDLEVGEDHERIYRLAGGALYWSKVQGRDVTWIYDPEVVRALSAEERAQHLEHSQALLGLRALARAIDAKDPSTREHSERVATLAALLAEAAGWPSERVALLHEAALLHDVGKIGVPDAVLLKPGRLEPEEYELVKEHSELGARIVSEVLTPEQVRWIRSHHERPDGNGYPLGLTEELIPEGAALLALADAFDVMTSMRSYSAPMGLADAIEECRAHAGRQFRPEAVAALEVVHDAGALDGTGPGEGGFEVMGRA